MLPLMQIHLLRMQFQAYITPRDREKQFAEYQTITETILSGDSVRSEKVAALHVRRTRLSLMRLPDEAFPTIRNYGLAHVDSRWSAAPRASVWPSPRRSRPTPATCFSAITATRRAAGLAAEAVAAAGARAHLVKADVGTPEGCAALADAVRAKCAAARSGRSFRGRRLRDDDAGGRSAPLRRRRDDQRHEPALSRPGDAAVVAARLQRVLS